MPDFTRSLFGLTQERLAAWLGANRTTLAAETGRHSAFESLRYQMLKGRVALGEPENLDF